MKCNVGKKDRNIRFIIALTIILAGLYFKSWWGLLSILPLATSYAGFCPLYKLLGITTCKQIPG